MSRRDSFVTHRAFCDALAQENNKLSQPMNMATVASAPLGQAAPHHLAPPSSSQPDEDLDAAACEDDDDFALDTKSPRLRMLPAKSDDAGAPNQLLLPPLSMAGCMLSSLQQGAARPAPPPPPSPATFFSGGGKAAGLDEPSMGGAFSPAAASASMSATALLQKAAEMGAAAGGYAVGAGAGFSTVGFGPMLGGPDHRLPVMGPFGPLKTPAALEPYDGLPWGQTQLVGLDVGRLLPGQQFYGSSHGHRIADARRWWWPADGAPAAGRQPLRGLPRRRGPEELLQCCQPLWALGLVSM